MLNLGFFTHTSQSLVLFRPNIVSQAETLLLDLRLNDWRTDGLMATQLKVPNFLYRRCRRQHGPLSCTSRRRCCWVLFPMCFCFFFRVLSFNFIYYTTTRDIIPLNIYYKHTYNTLDKHSYTYEGPRTHTHTLAYIVKPKHTQICIHTHTLSRRAP